jgi:hypothetical protein
MKVWIKDDDGRKFVFDVCRKGRPRWVPSSCSDAIGERIRHNVDSEMMERVPEHWIQIRQELERLGYTPDQIAEAMRDVPLKGQGN